MTLVCRTCGEDVHAPDVFDPNTQVVFCSRCGAYVCCAVGVRGAAEFESVVVSVANGEIVHADEYDGEDGK